MTGFFNLEETQLKQPVQTRGVSCASCGLYKNANSPKMKPQGNFKKKIMIIGDSPTAEEDKRGKLWTSPAGQKFVQECKRLGLDVYEDCVSLKAVNCYTDEPTPHQIACCRPQVFEAIDRYKPEVIILLGTPPIQSVIGQRWTSDLGGITKWQGYTIPDRFLNAWICPIYHPSFVERSADENGEASIIWRRDIKRAINRVGKPFPKVTDDRSRIVIDAPVEEVLEIISNEDVPFLAFDIETTGLKPYEDVHKILTISFCNQYDRAFAMPFPTHETHLNALKSVMENPRIKKVAANMKYEDTWLNILHGISVRGWFFDTMLASHIVDNRYGITGLKFQAYTEFGALGFDDYVEPYIKSAGTNIPNRMEELTSTENGMKEVLIYNGFDSLFEFNIAKNQMDYLGIKY